MKNCLSTVISVCLILGAMAAGVWMLFTGITDAAEQNALKAEYESAEGELTDYTLTSPGGYDPVRRRHTNDIYSLTYTYYVDFEAYTVTTDYGTGDIPILGSSRTVYFDPAHPENAILGGTNSATVLIFAGALFVLIPMIFILVFATVVGWIPHTRIDILDILVGLVLAGLGGGALFLMDGAFHAIKLIPILLAAAGIWLVIRGPVRVSRTKKNDPEEQKKKKKKEDEKKNKKKKKDKK